MSSKKSKKTTDKKGNMPMAGTKKPKIFQNLDNTYKTGFEAMTQIDFLDNYYFKVEMAYMYARNKDLEESLHLTPPFNSKLSLGYKKDNYWAKIQYNITSKQDNIAESFEKQTLMAIKL